MFAKLRLIALAAGMLIALLSLLALLQVQRFKHLLIEVESARISVAGAALKSDVERSLELGLALRDNGQLAAMLERSLRQNPSLVSIHLIDQDTDAGAILWQVGPPLTSTARIVAGQRRAPRESWLDERDARGFIQIWPVTDPIGRLVGSLAVRFDREKPAALIQQAAGHVLNMWLTLSALLLLALIPALLYLLHRFGHVLELAKNIMLGQCDTGTHNSDIAQLASQLSTAASAVEKART